MGKKVLIIDDDDKLRNLLREYLEGYGYKIDCLADGLDVNKQLKLMSPDIVILDVMMPHKNGLEVLADIRAISQVPVIMLTAKGEEADRIVGLEMGADDYLPKPFNPRELLARIKAVMRRSSANGKRHPTRGQRLEIEAGGLVLHTAKQSVAVAGNEIALSYTEYKVLKALMERPNTILSRDQLMSLAQGKDFMAFDRSIDVHISKLRTKVETDPGSPQRIKTIWGTGYMFVDTK
jgi:two-component system, OmpR family, phosphate regulon response regulator OmpR